MNVDIQLLKNNISLRSFFNYNYSGTPFVELI